MRGVPFILGAALLGSLAPTRAAGAAQAEEPAAVSARAGAGPKNALSVQLLALGASSLAIEYERFVAPPRFSLATSIAARRSGGNDFDVFEGAFGVEGRLWLLGRAPFTTFSEKAMVGPYVGLRADFGVTRVWGADERVLGTTMRWAESLSVGVRFAVTRWAELTPSVGTGLRTEVDPSGRLAPWTRPELVRLGVTLGVLF